MNEGWLHSSTTYIHWSILLGVLNYPANITTITVLSSTNYYYIDWWHSCILM